MWTWLQLFLMNCNKFRVIVFSRINMIFTDLEEIFTMGNLTTLSFAISLWQTVPCYYSNSILFINFSLESPRENFFFSDIDLLEPHQIKWLQTQYSKLLFSRFCSTWWVSREVRVIPLLFPDIIQRSTHEC